MLNYHNIATDWQPVVRKALATMDQTYLAQLANDHHWLPGPAQVFNAFQQPLANTRYLLLGESPYPRADSANGYAFWDAAVKDIWSANGLSKAVNRATSLRNFVKMLLLADGRLRADDTSQARIAECEKNATVQSLEELFDNLHQHGFLLLNASLVLSKRPVRQEAKFWQPFLETILIELAQRNPNVTLVLFGKIAEAVNKFPVAARFPQLCVEHPYNISFITQPTVIEFFKPFDLLAASGDTHEC